MLLNMNGALLFDSGKSELRQEAYPLIEKLGKIIEIYDQNIIEVEGHTDNVPTIRQNTRIIMFFLCIERIQLQSIYAMSPRLIRRISSLQEEANMYR